MGEAATRAAHGLEVEMRYRVHRFDLKMTQDQAKLERFLNDLAGDVVAVIPNVTLHVLWAQRVDFVLVVERVGATPDA